MGLGPQDCSISFQHFSKMLRCITGQIGTIQAKATKRKYLPVLPFIIRTFPPVWKLFPAHHPKAGYGL